MTELERGRFLGLMERSLEKIGEREYFSVREQLQTLG